MLKRPLMERAGGVSVAPARAGGNPEADEMSVCAAVLPGRSSVLERFCGAAIQTVVASLLVVAQHLKSPFKVPKGLFDAGVGILMVTVADAPKGSTFQQLEQSSAANRGRKDVSMISKWAFNFRRAKDKKQVARTLLQKAAGASPATRASILARFKLVKNPISTCRELDAVLTALVGVLTDMNDGTGEPAAKTRPIADVEEVSRPPRAPPNPPPVELRPATDSSMVLLQQSDIEGNDSGSEVAVGADAKVGARTAVASCNDPGPPGAAGVLESTPSAGNGSVAARKLVSVGEIGGAVSVEDVNVSFKVGATTDEATTGQAAAVDVLTEGGIQPRLEVGRGRGVQNVQETEAQRGCDEEKEEKDGMDSTRDDATTKAGTRCLAAGLRGEQSSAGIINSPRKTYATPTVSGNGAAVTRPSTQASLEGNALDPSSVAVDAHEHKGQRMILNHTRRCGDVPVETKTASYGGKITPGGPTAQVATNKVTGIPRATQGELRGTHSKHAKQYPARSGMLEKKEAGRARYAGGNVRGKDRDAQEGAAVKSLVVAACDQARGVLPRPIRASYSVLQAKQANAELSKVKQRLVSVQDSLALERKLRKRDAKKHKDEIEEMEDRLIEANEEYAHAKRKADQLQRIVDKYSHMVDELRRELSVRSPPLNMAMPPLQVRAMGEKGKGLVTRLGYTGKWLVPVGKVGRRCSSEEQAVEALAAARGQESMRGLIEQWKEFGRSQKRENKAPLADVDANDAGAPSPPDSRRTSFGHDVDDENASEVVKSDTTSTFEGEEGIHSDAERSSCGSTDEGGDSSDDNGDGTGSESSVEDSEAITDDGSDSNKESGDDTGSESSVEDSETTTKAKAVSDIPPHILATWASSPAPTAVPSATTSEDPDQDTAPLSREETVVASARRDILEKRATGLGVLSSMRGVRNGVAQKGESIGDGGYGVVFKLEMVDSALKRVVEECTEGDGVVLKRTAKDGEEHALREIEVLNGLMPMCHANVINVFATSVANRTVIMEAMRMDLQALIENKELLGGVSNEQLMRLCLSGAKGIAYLHGIGLVHGDVKPENFLLSKDLRRCKITDFGSSGEAGVAAVGSLTVPYAAPEAVGICNGEDFTLDKSMDVWSMAIVTLQALFRRPLGPTEADVLSDYDRVLFPRESLEAFRVAQDNFDILQARAYDSNAAADIEAKGRARRDLRELRSVYSGMRAKTMPLTDYILSESVWKEFGQLVHQAEVQKVLSSMLHRDPRRRIAIDDVVASLALPQLWSMEPTRLGSPKPRVLPDSADAVLQRVDRTLYGEVAGGPSWLEVAKSEDTVWWEPLPVPPAVEEAGET